ncbi:DUF2193 domain-containing protein [Methanococcus maripaludis]|uniref:DUF2193 domain-containing protein n=1 Tax=Methanococcus maripaludis TaxID=39152 RepID=A0A2L1C7Z2_METMI|nr:DUF2193 domain-containing protein [Methanococcus maripaludis]AVB75449.1 hypothetical protein MMJJ_00300 [Methanococcus maripaludis]MBB6496220.1 hypothetical protein [Methanococcus maripaludis]
MEEIYSKMVNEAMAAQWADVDIIKEKRGHEFKIKHAKGYVDVANKMEAVGNQDPSVIKLHKDSINAHFDILSELTKTVRPEDDPFVEHYQTPAILEILYKEDPEFRKSVEKFIQTIEKSEALIGKEVLRRYGGFYGPTCVVDFALIPGSTSNIVNRILKNVDIPIAHKQAILASKSWGMNTSYGFGEKFTNAVEAGKSLNEAIKEEIEMIKFIYDKPIDAQAKLMDDFGHESFDVRKYMGEYKKKMESAVSAAMESEVHYGNIVTIPAYCVGDIAHHVAQSTFNMCKDDVVMGVIEAVSTVMDNTLRSNVKNFKNEYEVLSLATGSTAAATECMLELDGFNAPTVVDLLTKRFHNYVQLYPTRGAAAELHNHDFMDMIYRGWKLIDKARRVKNGSDAPITPKIGNFKVDLDPIFKNEVIMNPQRYAYPACAITVRFSALMRLADYPCLLTSEPVTATMMTNIIALHKETPGAPARVCKDCATACLVDFRHQYCQYREAV